MDAKTALAIVAAFACLSGAPAAPAVHHGSTDGSTTVTCGTSTMLFGGAVPANGFMVGATGYTMFVNDNGPAAQSPQQGFYVPGVGFITPPGYKPMGPVTLMTVGCPSLDFHGTELT
jgi:hypothetical protein